MGLLRKSDSIAGPDRSGEVSVFKARRGWRFVDVGELYNYRDLLYFLVWRDIKVKYAQSVLGIGWAIIQPVFFMIVFSVVFGNLAKVGSDGAPYAIFSYVALVPWLYFSNSMNESAGSLVSSAEVLNKVYFPRLIIPLAPVIAKLLDFGIAFVLIIGLLLWYQITPTIWVIVLPWSILVMMLAAAGTGMWLTAMAIQYRDVKYGVGLVIQLLMYAAPVVYPASLIPDQYKLLYALNPMVGVIESFRSSIIGTNDMPWDTMIIGTATAILIAVSGAVFFGRMERRFADVG